MGKWPERVEPGTQREIGQMSSWDRQPELSEDSDYKHFRSCCWPTENLPDSVFVYPVSLHPYNVSLFRQIGFYSYNLWPWGLLIWVVRSVTSTLRRRTHSSSCLECSIGKAEEGPGLFSVHTLTSVWLQNCGEWTAVVLTFWVCGTLLWWPQEMEVGLGIYSRAFTTDLCLKLIFMATVWKQSR